MVWIVGTADERRAADAGSNLQLGPAVTSCSDLIQGGGDQGSGDVLTLCTLSPIALEEGSVSSDPYPPQTPAHGTPLRGQG